MKKSIIRVEGLTATVKLNNGDFLTTVNNVGFQLSSGESYAIVGKSGSGKTSLISVLGLLNSAFQGEYYYEGMSVSKMSDKELSRLRSREFGFVFQNYNLVPTLNVYENIVLPVRLDGKIEDKKFLEKIIDFLELDGRLSSYPNHLSGGQQQRVAIARALISKPAIILADEPTGNLDSRTSEKVIDLLKMTSEKFHQTIVMITHNPEIAEKADMRIRIEDGKITHKERSK